MTATFCRLLAALAACTLLLPGPVRAQGFSRPTASPRAQAAPGPVPKPEPKQRLDAGALVCRTEADLQQHQAAVTASLDGNAVAEPAGCRPIRTMTPVTVLDRHGEARTQVRLAGTPEQLGWTDAIIHAP